MCVRVCGLQGDQEGKDVLVCVQGGAINKIPRKLTNEKQKRRDFQKKQLHNFLWAAAQVCEIIAGKAIENSQRPL